MYIVRAQTEFYIKYLFGRTGLYNQTKKKKKLNFINAMRNLTTRFCYSYHEIREKESAAYHKKSLF